MDSEENFARRKEFRQLLRKELTNFFDNHSYQLIYDNSHEDEPSSWVFKLVFQGIHKFEISNDDWRDYTEYFNLYWNDINIRMMNIDDYPNLNQALREVETAFKEKMV